MNGQPFLANMAIGKRPGAGAKLAKLFPNNALIANGWPELNQYSENHFLDLGVKRR